MAKITASALKHKYPEWNIITVQGSDDENKIVNFDVPNVENPPEESEWPSIQKEYEDYLKSIQYQRDRASAYPDLKEQFDLLWHAIDDGKFNVKSKDTDFYKKLKAVKDANPKPE